MSYSNERTDAELLAEFCEGRDQRSFASLVKRHSPMVHAVSMRVMSNHHDAQDVTQAVFLVLAREASKLIREPSVAGWLHTVARRLSLNAQQSRASRKHREEKTMINNNTSPDQIEAKEFREELDNALNRLPDRYRQPLVLFHLEGASLNEVADQLELNLNTVRTNLSRARDLLRRALSRHGIKTASVSALSALLAVEAKAANPISPDLYSSIFDTATNPGASIPSHVLHLAEHASIPSLSLTNILPILMKTKTTIIAASCALLITGVSVVIVSNRNNKASGNQSQNENSQRRHSSRGESQNPNGRKHKLAGTSTSAEFEALCNSVASITDHTARLEAIRNKLGIDLSNEEYTQLTKKVGFQNDPQVFLNLLYHEYLMTDPQRFFKWSERLEDGPVKSLVPIQAVMTWLKTDKEAAMAYAKANLDQEQLDEVLGYLDQLDSQAENTPKEFSVDQLRQMTTQLKSLRDQHSETYADSQEDAEGQPELREELRSKAEDLRRKISDSIAALGERDPKAAAEMAVSLHPGSLRSAMKKFAPMDPDAAHDFALNIKDPALRETALLVALPAMALKYPHEEMDLSALSDKGQSKVITKIVKDWALEEPRAAMDYAITQEDLNLKKTAIRAAAKSWAVKDRDAVEQWAEQQPAGEVLQIALPGIAVNASKTDLNTARNLLEKIQDHETKQTVILEAIGNGLSHDFDNALALADGLETVDSFQVEIWVHRVSENPNNTAALKAWIEDARKTGKVTELIGK